MAVGCGEKVTRLLLLVQQGECARVLWHVIEICDRKWMSRCKWRQEQA